MMFGRDTKSNDVTDFGGGVKKGETLLSACLREFKEETEDIFDEDHYSHNNRGFEVGVIYHNKSTIFLPVKDDWIDKSVKRFGKKMVTLQSPHEISEVLWFPISKLYEVLKRKKEAKVEKKTSNKKKEEYEFWSQLKSFYMPVLTQQHALKVLENLYYLKHGINPRRSRRE